jgi:Kdo2-lipid IVA lauroyltransferase/acyltransferase
MRLIFRQNYGFYLKPYLCKSNDHCFFMDRLTYFLFRSFSVLFSMIPFRLLYIFSDALFFVIFYLVRYRKKVVYNNIRNSFPAKTEAEVDRIARQFYHHFTDLFIESLKSFSMKEADIVKRYRYSGTEVLDALYKEGKSVICVAGHYGNWEWGGVASGPQLAHKPVGFYKPLSNKYIDAFVQKTRVKGRSRLASILDTAATFATDWGEPAIYYMVADQSPSSPRLAYWMQFLNQDTAVLHGPEKYARIHNLPVVFAWVKKIRRGYYTVEFRLLDSDPSKTKTGDISTRYMQMLEKVIQDQPQYYLWSHRRWKLKR